MLSRAKLNINNFNIRLRATLNLLKSSKNAKLYMFGVLILLAFGVGNLLIFTKIIRAESPNAFITTWKVSGDSNGRTVKIPIYRAADADEINHIGYNYSIDWGDGSPVEAKSGYVSPSHTYANDGEYDIKIEGDFPGMTFAYRTIKSPQKQVPKSDAFNNFDESEAMAKKIIKLKQWGNIKWQNMDGMFKYASQMTGVYTDSPDTSEVLSMRQMFDSAEKFNSPVNFDTSKVTDMYQMFRNTPIFNQPINFDTSNAEDMHGMFQSARSFNQPLNFNTSKATRMYNMFHNATSFNSPINFSDTSKVTNMGNMFKGATSFNQPLNFDTQNVIGTESMFEDATSFNQDISNLDYSTALRMGQNYGIKDFANNSGLSISNYDKLIKKWSNSVKNDPIINFQH